MDEDDEEDGNVEIFEFAISGHMFLNTEDCVKRVQQTRAINIAKILLVLEDASVT